MLGFLSLCLAWAWDLPTGNPVAFNVYADHLTEPLLEEVQPGVEVCFHDNSPHVIAVAGVDAAGVEGPLSDWSTPVQLMFEGGIEFVLASDADRSDYDRSGVVDGGDYGTFVFSFGKTAMRCVDGRRCE
jgi:hypothetical protein